VGDAIGQFRAGNSILIGASEMDVRRATSTPKRKRQTLWRTDKVSGSCSEVRCGTVPPSGRNVSLVHGRAASSGSTSRWFVDETSGVRRRLAGSPPQKRAIKPPIKSKVSGVVTLVASDSNYVGISALYSTTFSQLTLRLFWDQGFERVLMN